jgi:hypothetical protein
MGWGMGPKGNHRDAGDAEVHREDRKDDLHFSANLGVSVVAFEG